MRSSATEEVLDDRADLGLHGIRRLRGADQPHALGLGSPDLEVALPDSAVEGELLAFEVVQASPADSPQPLGRIEIEQQGEIGHDAAGRARVELADQVEIDAATVALVGDRRVGITIAEHDAVTIEPRPDPLG